MIFLFNEKLVFLFQDLISTCPNCGTEVYGDLSLHDRNCEGVILVWFFRTITVSTTMRMLPEMSKVEPIHMIVPL